MNRATLLAVVLALSLATYALAPAPWDGQAWLVGNWFHPDCVSNHWLVGWGVDRLLHGRDLLHNDRYYWPVGDHPVLSGNGVEGVFALPFWALLGWPRGMVAYALAVLSLNGLAGYALARAAGAERWASLITAAALGAMPYTLQEMSAGRFSQANPFWLWFFLAAWLRFLDAPDRRRALLASALLAATTFFYWYYGFFAVLAGGLLLGAAVAGRRAPSVPLLATFSAAYLVLIAPWAWFFYSHWDLVVGTGEVVQFPHPEALRHTFAPRWPFLVRTGHEMPHAHAASTFGLAILGAGFALWRGGALARGLVVVWLAFYGLSLGALGPFAPYTLLYGLTDALRRFWWPLRHEVVAQSAAAALAALALSRLEIRLRPALRPLPGLLGALSVPLLLAWQGAQTQVTLTALDLPPPLYPELGKKPGFGLIEPPLSPELGGAQQQLIYQLYHRKTLISGTALWVDRVRPDAWDAAMQGNSFLHGLQELERGHLQGRLQFKPEDLRHLIDAGFVWASLNREMFPLNFRETVNAYSALFTALFGQPVLRDTGAYAWDTTAWNGRADLEVLPAPWPEGIAPGGPDQRVTGRRVQSPVFGRGRGGRPLPSDL